MPRSLICSPEAVHGHRGFITRAARCTLVRPTDKTRVLLSNIRSAERGGATAINKDYKAAITTLAGSNSKLDVVIMDPPYDQTEYYGTAMEMLQEYELLEEGSIVICEHLYGR